MSIQRIALISVHTSPLAPLGGKKTGGMNVYVRELAQELGKRGIEIDIFTRKVTPSEPEVNHGLGERVRVISIPAGPLQPLGPDELYEYLQQFAAGIIRYATRNQTRYNIVYSHYWLSGWVAYKLKEVWGTPFVHMYHTLGQMKKRIIGAVTLPPLMPDTRIVTETQIADWADAIIAATPAEQAQLLWLYRAKRRKIHIIPPGVNLERFRPASMSDARKRIGLAENTNLLLFVGRIERLKAVDTIIEAINILRQQEPSLLQNLCFAVIGGNPNNPSDEELERLQALCNELGLKDIVKFLGARDQDSLRDYYTAATCVIMPSDYESFGMVALEAMATGTPVIASEVGGLAYLVRHNETGYHVPVREPSSIAQCIMQLLKDETKYKKMGQSASELARQYSWSNIADRLLAVFEAVLAAPTAD